MSGPATLLVVIGALYLLECIVAVPGGLVAFRGTARASWRLLGGGFRIGTRGTRLHFVPLLPWESGLLFAGGEADLAPNRTSPPREPGTSAPDFDIAAVRERIAGFRAATAALRVDAVAMFALVFIVSPAIVQLLGWDASWPFVAVAVIVIAGFIVGDHRRAHADLFPETRAPIGTLVTLALSPASAMRACDPLAREVLARRHTLAVACVLCPSAEFERIAAGCVRAWRRGEPPLPTAEAFLTSQLGDLGRLAAAPERRDASARSYCPSCLAEFVVESGACEECGGVGLEPFGERVATHA